MPWSWVLGRGCGVSIRCLLLLSWRVDEVDCRGHRWGGGNGDEGFGTSQTLASL